jgi:hypothetical protein
MNHKQGAMWEQAIREGSNEIKAQRGLGLAEIIGWTAVNQTIRTRNSSVSYIPLDNKNRAEGRLGGGHHHRHRRHVDDPNVPPPGMNAR